MSRRTPAPSSASSLAPTPRVGRFALALVGVFACATTSGDNGGGAQPGEGAAPSPSAVVTSTPTPFENPGGMWMPAQLAQQADTLRRAGFGLDPAVLTDPTAFPLGAVVSLGGCSASFVSPDGLIITNHHCVTGYLQENSTPERNLLKDGFLATDRADERSGGPLARVYVTRKVESVTEKILGGLDSITDPSARYKEIERRRKDVVATCEKANANTRCQVASFYDGAEFFQIEQLEIRDVRLVYAPSEGIGVFGGEIDNWRWPRHTGDYSFLRAYVGADGKPADYSKKNVPFKPPHHLKVAQDAIDPGEYVMVAGYPGRTNRLKTAAEVQEAATWYYPRQIAMYQEYIAVLEGTSRGREELEIKAAKKLRGLNNYLTNFKGQLDGLVKGKLADEKVRLEGELRAWIDGDAGRKAKYGDVLATIESIAEADAKTRDRDQAEADILHGAALLGVAEKIVTMAEERQKPDAERSAGFQQRDLARQEQALAALDKSYDPDLDRAVFKLFLERAARLPEDQRPTALKIILGDGPIDGARIDAVLADLYAKTKLGKAKDRIALFKKASVKSLKSSRDPFIQLALALRPTIEASKKEREARAGALAAVRPRYIEALRTFQGGVLAPDANGTLRVTYGTVRGYRPRPGAPIYRPFTVLSELIAKHTGEEPFDAPDGLLEAAKSRKFGPYVDAELGELPVNFLADLDITGGNSGSATLNAKGELVGLVFDGNYEAMASDWIFMPEITRSIHVDIRYVLWVMDAVDHAEGLMTEMGVQPTIE